jgi:release factor glutamine methyltransferase
MGILFKKILSPLWRPLVKLYLRKPRSWSYNKIRVRVSKGVFHPRFFFSTKHLIRFLDKQNLNALSFLEIGSGSGIVSISAAKKGAKVTAVDISSQAVLCTSDNARRNKIDLITLQSDLFEKIPKAVFQVIAVNPPYYPEDPKNESEHAWFAGKEFQYFSRFFKEAISYVDAQSQLFMVLSDECEINRISEITEKLGWKSNLVESHKNWSGVTFIYSYSR